MSDERSYSNSILGYLNFSSSRALLKATVSLIIATIIAGVPSYPGLIPEARWTLFIMLFAAGLWILEAIPAFAVGVLIIGLEIMVLGQGDGVATRSEDWTVFVQPWASPLIWLFFGGFVLAIAAKKTGLDRWLSEHTLRWFGSRPSSILLGVMIVTFVFSMFISNTATTVLMIAAVSSIVSSLQREDPFSKALLLGVPVAANLGGMGTIIGSPPNAIAAGALNNIHPVDFLTWTYVALPPSIILFLAAYIFLVKRYPCQQQKLEIKRSESLEGLLPMWQRLVVMVVFVVTIALWLTESIHRVPTAVVSFLPLTVFSATGVITAQNIRQLHWDVLLLIAGGLSLGETVTRTGLADWLVEGLPQDALGPVLLAFGLAYLCSGLSNFMSNTAAANILIPISLALGDVGTIHYVVPVALAASSAMCLPVSTPPNAIAFSKGGLNSHDFIGIGLFIGIATPVITIPWCRFFVFA